MIPPEHLHYTLHHQWIEFLSDGSVQVGITNYAQKTLGDIMFVECPLVENHVITNQPCGIIESAKAASDLLAPLSGKITEINSELQLSPERINDAPYETWIFRMHPENTDEQNTLLDAMEYQEIID